jgi:hypothetical protein
MNLLALGLAALGLGLFILARRRASASGRPGPPLVLLLVPLAIIVGILPVVLHLGEPIRIAASIISIIFSLVAIGSLLAHSLRNRRP